MAYNRVQRRRVGLLDDHALIFQVHERRERRHRPCQLRLRCARLLLAAIHRFAADGCVRVQNIIVERLRVCIDGLGLVGGELAVGWFDAARRFHRGVAHGRQGRVTVGQLAVRVVVERGVRHGAQIIDCGAVRDRDVRGRVLRREREVGRVRARQYQPIVRR